MNEIKYGISIQNIDQIISIFSDVSKIEEVIIFGSRVKGSFKPGSDIDLAVKGSNLTFDDLLKLYGKLDELNLPYKLDLILYNDINDKEVLSHIKRLGKVFYKKCC
jgi:uncharacterized protein